MERSFHANDGERADSFTRAEMLCAHLREEGRLVKGLAQYWGYAAQSNTMLHLKAGFCW
jgi:hypothetical protein